MIQTIKEAVEATSLIEWIAVTTGVIYLLLITKKQIIGWLFAIVSSVLYVYLTLQAKIYNETLLQSYYVIIGFYGWWAWNKAKSDENFIVRWTLKTHVLQAVIASIISIIIGYFISKYTDDSLPYLDTFCTIFSFIATFMDTRRVLDNWLYWIVIDLALIFLYSGRGLYLTGLLYFIYTIIAIFAYRYWYKYYKLQQK